MIRLGPLLTFLMAGWPVPRHPTRRSAFSVATSVGIKVRSCVALPPPARQAAAIAFDGFNHLVKQKITRMLLCVFLIDAGLL